MVQQQRKKTCKQEVTKLRQQQVAKMSQFVSQALDKLSASKNPTKWELPPPKPTNKKSTKIYVGSILVKVLLFV